MSRSVLRAIQIVGGIAALGLLGFAVRSAWMEVAAVDVQFRVGVAVLAVGSLFVTLLGVIALWRQLLTEFTLSPGQAVAGRGARRRVA
jgi:uncharacterized membrane protein